MTRKLTGETGAVLDVFVPDTEPPATSRMAAPRISRGSVDAICIHFRSRCGWALRSPSYPAAGADADRDLTQHRRHRVVIHDANPLNSRIYRVVELAFDPRPQVARPCDLRKALVKHELGDADGRRELGLENVALTGE
jgi:hypothetical protein